MVDLGGVGGGGFLEMAVNGFRGSFRIGRQASFSHSLERIDLTPGPVHVNRLLPSIVGRLHGQVNVTVRTAVNRVLH